MDYNDLAERDATARMLEIQANPGARHDGRDYVREALDCPMFQKRLTNAIRAGVLEGEDEAEVGRMVIAQVLEYVRSCPRWEDTVSEYLAQNSVRRVA